MFHMNKNLKVVLTVEPVDWRKSFNGLYAIAHNELEEVPENGVVFVFANRTRTRVKVLCFDGTGCWAHARRKFHEARNESTFAAQILLEIQGLYKIETKLRNDPSLDRRAVR